jgi:quaternary ammonium compound-resistance protein SugE
VVGYACRLHVDALASLGLSIWYFGYSAIMSSLWVTAFLTGMKGEGALEMAWLTLLVARLFEVGWEVGLKYNHGFRRLWPTVTTVVCMALSFTLLAQALKTLPIGTAYAVWTGIGTVGTAVLGIALFSEPMEALRLGCILFIVIGITGLRLLG